MRFSPISETLVNGRLDRNSFGELIGIIEPMSSQPGKSLMGRKTSIKTNERTPVQVISMNNFPSTLKTGTQIAGLHPIVPIVRELNTVYRVQTKSTHTEKEDRYKKKKT